MKQIASTIVLLLSLCFHASASHIAGGELRYEYSGNNNYTLILKLYGDCAGVAMPANAMISLSSVSQSSSFTVTMVRTSLSVVTTPCPGNANRCINPSSPVPGYHEAVYKATVTLPANASDWKMEFTTGARTSLNNISGSTGNIYLYANLDNSNGANSVPYIAAMPPFYATTGTFTSPIQAVDPDGDSIVIETTAPLHAANTPVIYSTGYSLAKPLGATGIYTINSANQTMTIKGSTYGQHALAFRVKEYRNNTLIGTYNRDFIVGVLPSTTMTFTFPMINSSSSATAYACAGNSGSATLSFTDPTSTDSVFIEVDTPALTGWNFNTSVTPGAPTGTVTVSWTAPSNLTPQSLPFFFVDLHVYDNACPRAETKYALLVKTQCPTDSVWPGDANSDKIVNLLDPLAIAVAYNQTGPVRPGASTSWTPQWSQDWGATYPISGVNVKHGDCNGDGTINLSDLGAVITNWGLTHPKPGPARKTSGAPDLYFDVNGISFSPGATVTVPVKLGDAASPMQGIYGLGTSITISSLDVQTQATVSIANSWIGNSTNTLEFKKDKTKAIIDWAYARTDHTNIDGNGTIATVTFDIPSTAKAGETFTLGFANTVMIDKDGQQITQFNEVNTDVTLVPQSVGSIAGALQYSGIVPNPSGDAAKLYLQLSANENVTTTITDISGKVLWQDNQQLDRGEHYITLPADQLSSGMYIVNIQMQSTEQSLKWIKQ